MAFGAAGCPTRGEWLRTSLSSKGWCPSAPRNSTRGLLTVVAAYCLKYLLFDNRTKDAKGKYLPPETLVHTLLYGTFKGDRAKFIILQRGNFTRILLKHFRLLHPDEKRQQEALCVAISEILWKAGEQKKCVVALPQDIVYVQHSHSYYQDTITERVGFSHKNIYLN